MNRKRNVIFAICVSIALTGCATGPEKKEGKRIPALQTGFIQKTMIVDGEERAYSLYVPENYDPDTLWPTIVFLHGMGERGDDAKVQTEVGIGPAIRRDPERFPCLVIMPQCPKTKVWTSAANHIDTALKMTAGEYSVDPARVYLSGLSMGGFGTWSYGARTTETFAALMPICGGGSLKDAQSLAKIPIWTFHGADDPVVPPERSRVMVEAIRKEGGNVQFTLFPDTGHNSWDKAYGNPEAIAWLLRQSRP